MAEKEKQPDYYAINGAFSFKGLEKDKLYEIANGFFDWCKEQEKSKGIHIMMNRADYNGYIDISPTSQQKPIDNKK